MHILVIGASGRTGSWVVKGGLARGHVMTAMVRNADSVAPLGTRVVVGDPKNVHDVASATAGQDVVISCLGQRSASDRDLLRTAALAAVRAMESSSARRLIVISQGLLFPSNSPLTALLRWALKRHVTDSLAMEEIVQNSSLQWTIVRPPRLLNGHARQGYRTQVDARPQGGSSIQRTDLADYLLDEAERNEHSRRIVGITSL